MSRFLLDTNNWILLLKQPPTALRQRLDAQPAGNIVVCSVVKAELWHGARKYQNAQERQRIVENLPAPYVSLPFDDAAARHYADIRHLLETRAQIIGPNDLSIAAICAAHGLTLVSANTNEFVRIPALRMEDWTKA